MAKKGSGRVIPIHRERIVEYLAVQQRANKLTGPILCLVGPAGAVGGVADAGDFDARAGLTASSQSPISCAGLSFGHTSSYKLQTSIPTNGDTDEKRIKETRLDNSTRS